MESVKGSTQEIVKMQVLFNTLRHWKAPLGLLNLEKVFVSPSASFVNIVVKLCQDFCAEY